MSEDVRTAISWEDALPVLAVGATLVTATRRLARALRAAYDDTRRAEGRKSWPSPTILPYEAWLERVWDTIDIGRARSHVLLTPAQEQALWERVVADSPQADGLLQVSATARSAAEAWRLLADWRIPLDAVRREAPPDAVVFCDWVQVFLRQCQAHGWRDRAQLVPSIMAEAAAGRRAFPSQVLWAGFDELTPAHVGLREALSEAGIAVADLMPEVRSARVVRLGRPDAEAEIEAAARWARALLETEPHVRIGVVVHDLDSLRSSLERLFGAVLHPDGGSGAFNISLGVPLAGEPVIAAALRVLELAAGRLSLDAFGGLLRSPFLEAGEREQLARARLDARLRALGEAEVHLLGPHGVLGRSGLGWSYCTVFRDRLARLRQAVESAPRVASAGAWTRLFDAWTRLLGWPGERTSNSREYQAVGQWSEVLSRFAALDAQLDAESLGSALARLRRMAAETPFQVQTADAPIQVLGVLEAGGLQFDHLWLMGLSDAVWPPAARPNPFIPIELQRRHGMPHSSAARELAFASRVTERLLGAAAHVIVSHPLREADTPRRVSPLLADLPEVELGDLPQSEVELGIRRVHRATRLETWCDDRGPGLETSTAVVGGTGILRDQAACPFRAFAHHRLGAVGLEQPQAGLAARDRGALVHRALESVWRELGDHGGLIALPRALLKGKVEAAVAEGLAELRQHRPLTLTERLITLEQTRITGLVLEWLALEARRPPFTVMAREQVVEAEIGGLRLQGRIDRLDRLADGGLVIIDYKTGKASPAVWGTDRPDEPQLPFYALVQDEPVSAVAFALLRRGEMAFRGLATCADLIPGVQEPAQARPFDGQPSWETVLAGWRESLEALARGFVAGDARVDPKSNGQTCRYCDVHPLCRVAELAARWIAVDDEPS